MSALQPHLPAIILVLFAILALASVVTWWAARKAMAKVPPVDATQAAAAPGPAMRAGAPVPPVPTAKPAPAAGQGGKARGRSVKLKGSALAAIPARVEAVSREIGQRVSGFASNGGGAADGPLVLLVGVPGAGATALAAAAGATTVTPRPDDPEMPEGVALLETVNGRILDFGDHLLEREDWRQHWRHSLDALAAHRARGCCDGLVLALPLPLLRDIGQRSPGSLPVLGEHLGALLADLQQTAGLCVPITLILTEADDDPAFAAMAARAGETGASGTLVGWSSPHGPRAPFEPTWVDEAMTAIAAAFDAISFDAAGMEGGAGVLGLSAEIRPLGQTLTAVLGPMMRTNADTAPDMLRGIYLAGTVREGRTAFAKALFDQKIFPETSLARWARGRSLRDERRARRLRLTTLVLAPLALAGLMYLSVFHNDRQDVVGLLSLIETFTTRDALATTGGGTQSMAVLTNQTAELFGSMAQLNVATLTTWLAPFSKLSKVDREVRKAVAIGFDDIALVAIRRGLREQVFDLVAATPRGAALDLDAFQTMAEELANIDTFVGIYNGLRTSTNPSDLSRLSKRALGIEPPQQFNDSYALYINALADIQTPAFDGTRVWPSVSEVLGDDLDALYRNFYRQSELGRALGTIVSTASWLPVAPLDDPDVLVARLDGLVAAINTAERLLQDQAQNWIDDDKAAFEARLGEATATLAGLSFAKPGITGELRAARAATRSSAREAALALTGFGGRPVLVETEGQTALSPLYTRARTAIVSLLATENLQPISTAQGGGGDAQAGARFGWAVQPLREASDTTEWLLSSASSALSETPSDLRQTLTALVRARAQERITGLLSLAMRPLQSGGYGEDAARAEDRAFAAAAPLLADLRDNARVLGLPQPLSLLSRTASAQARRLLSDADIALAAERAYAPYQSGVDAWDGRPGGAPAIFGVSGTAALAGLVREWRIFVQILAQTRAQPALAYLGNERVDPRTAGRIATWRDILTTLDEFTRSKPRNGLSELERFILVDISSLSIETCPKVLADARPGAGWFGERQAAIIDALSVRCGLLETTASEDVLSSLSEGFNSALAGRFPFVGAGAGAPLSDPGRLANTADPATVRQFLSSFASDIAELTGQGAGAFGQGIAATQGRDFVQVLGAVQSFLGAKDGVLPPGALAYAVDVDFDTNHAQAPGQSEVVEWTMTVGSDTVFSFQPLKALIWRQGDPVSLSAQWASGATNQPASLQRPDATLTGRRLTLSYDGPWALFALIAANAAPAADLRILSKPAPNMLRIDVPLVPNAVAATGGLPVLPRATLRPRITLRALDQRGGKPVGAPLAMPIFPARGPVR